MLITLTMLAGCQRKAAEYVSEQDLMDVVANKIDPSVNPADDFFNWANGGWFKSFPMPASESQWGIEAIVNEEVFQNTIQICRNAALSNPLKGTIEQKIGDLWTTGMDTAAIETQGLKYVEPLLKNISDISDFKALFAVIGQIQAYNINPLFYGYVYQDKKYSNQYAFYINQGDLNISTHDYYTGNDAMSVKVRHAYLEYLNKTFTHLGESPKLAALHANCVLKIETFLAQNDETFGESGDPYGSYNKRSIADWEKLTPSVNWRIMLDNMGCPVDSLVVEEVNYIRKLDKAFKHFALEEWKCYLKFYTTNAISAYLPMRFRLAQFAFYGKTIDGRKEKKPQWKFMLEIENQVLGDGLGQIFVKDFFPEKTQKRYMDMVDNVKTAFTERIKELDWMEKATKEHALKKLAIMKRKVGYPNQWKTFTSMTKSLFTFHVTSALDRNKTSDREAVRLMVPIISALGCDPTSLPISRSTIRRVRKKTRKDYAESTRGEFLPEYPLVLHWDSKILPQIVGCGEVHRLPVLVSGDGMDKLLSVPKLSSGTANNEATAVYDLLQLWNLKDKVEALTQHL